MLITLISQLTVSGAAALTTPALQNPQPPYVKLPAGWETKLGGAIESGGMIKGPSGAEIFFPAYTRTGVVAYAQTSLDRRTRFLRAVINGQRIDVAFTSKNLLVVSYPSADFWTQPKDVRQAVTAFMILLTHIDESPSKSDTPAVPTMQLRSDRSNFPFVRFAAPFAYEASTDSFRDRGYEGRPDGWVRFSAKPLPVSNQWENEVSIGQATLKVVEDENRNIISRFTDRNGKEVTYVGSPDNMVVSLLTVLASLTRERL